LSIGFNLIITQARAPAIYRTMLHFFSSRFKVQTQIIASSISYMPSLEDILPHNDDSH